jgi:hypothetical protein
VLDHIMPDLSPNGWKVLCAAMRQTLGWVDENSETGRKEKDCISYSQFMKMTGIKSSATLANAIKENLDKGYLLREPSQRHPQGFDYRLNRDYETSLEIKEVSQRTSLETEEVSDKTSSEIEEVHQKTSLETEDTKERDLKKQDLKKLPAPSAEKPDYLTHCADIADGQASWTVPPQAGETNAFTDGPVTAFAEVLAGIPPLELPDEKRNQWGIQLGEVAADWSTKERIITPADMEQAIRAIPDSGIGWKTYTSPFAKGFAEDIGTLLLGSGPQKGPSHGTHRNHRQPDHRPHSHYPAGANIQH